MDPVEPEVAPAPGEAAQEQGVLFSVLKSEPEELPPPALGRQWILWNPRLLRHLAKQRRNRVCCSQSSSRSLRSCHPQPWAVNGSCGTRGCSGTWRSSADTGGPDPAEPGRLQRRAIQPLAAHSERHACRSLQRTFSACSCPTSSSRPRECRGRDEVQFSVEMPLGSHAYPW
ncbi:rCG38684 [Rattus norvegicus]|uniref:RCG38684 n=1 Tax=Rattus norvegicus TaxID=10116 RepID=A6K9Y0_RAT|nr:rCG38684 [Rattus norvegicus]